MLVIKMGFPGGRYYATPWDKHVNEGLVEWPPSPWRFLRAIISTWYTKGDGVSFEVLQALVERLAIPPEFVLPPATLASTCHYMPSYRSTLDGKTVNVYDAFAHIGDGALYIIWNDVNLDNEQRQGLDTLISRMGYLGRSESWVEGGVVDLDIAPNTRLVDDASTTESVSPALCCLTPLEYLSWRGNMISTLLAQREKEKRAKADASGKGFKGLSAKDKKDVEALVPATLFEALLVDTCD